MLYKISNHLFYYLALSVNVLPSGNLYLRYHSMISCTRLIRHKFAAFDTTNHHIKGESFTLQSICAWSKLWFLACMSATLSVWFFWDPTLDLLNTVTHPFTHKNLHFDVVNVLIVCIPTCWTFIRKCSYNLGLADDECLKVKEVTLWMTLWELSVSLAPREGTLNTN